MKDKIWEATMIILGCIVAIIITWVVLMWGKSIQVDCERYEAVKETGSYRPVPKQCEEGEK